jgi:hypothetical protein
LAHAGHAAGVLDYLNPFHGMAIKQRNPMDINLLQKSVLLRKR